MCDCSDEVKTQGHLEPNEVCMTQHHNKTRLRALCAVLTRAACARRGLRRETC